MDKTKLFVSVQGFDEDKLVEVDPHQHVAEIANAAKVAGLPVPQNAVFFKEEEAEPLNAGVSLAEAGVKPHTRVHITRCQKITVVAHYGKEEVEKAFPPSAPVSAVHAWAAGKLLSNELDRKEHILQVCDSDVQPTPRTQIGTLITDEKCELCFDLVAAVRVEG